MRIVDVEAKHERLGQADHADQSQRRGDADAGHRPEVGDDFRDPAIPQVPPHVTGAGLAVQSFQDRPQRIDEIEQGRRLMPYFMHQGRGDAGADHALTRHPYDGNGILAAARQPRAGTPDGGADVTIEIANHRRRLVIGGQLQRVGGDHVETA